MVIVGFSKPKSWKPFAWAIQRYQNTEYSHVYFKIYLSKMDKWIILESAGLETRILTESNWLQHSEIIEEYIIESSKLQRIDLFEECLNNMGKSYGITQIAGILISNLLKLKHNLISTGSDYQICSEFVGRLLQDIYKVKMPKDLDLLTPKDINNLLTTCKIVTKSNKINN